MDAQFDLVLILERFDESLVLLQDLMCWPTEDIVYLKQNERIAKGVTSQNIQKDLLLKQAWLSPNFDLQSLN